MEKRYKKKNMNICKHCGVVKEEGYTFKSTYQCRTCCDGIARYGLNRNDMIKLWEEEGKKCGICRKELEMFKAGKGGFVDHNHDTGKIRGILCIRCNSFLGKTEKVEQIKIYLSGVRHK